MAHIPLISRITYHLHVRAALLDGVVAGVLATRDVVACKAFNAGSLALVLITMAPALAAVSAAFLAPHIESWDRRRIFILGGLFGRLSLLWMALVVAPHMLPWFIALCIVSELSLSVIIPAVNSVYQANYDVTVRGRLYSRASAYQALMTAVVALVVGWILDWRADSYRVLYPVAGIAAMGYCILFARIRLRRLGGSGSPLPAAQARPVTGLRRSLQNLREVLVEDRRFRGYQIAFFLYGIGFMMMQPVFAPFFVDQLGMGYGEASWAKGVVFPVGWIVGLPLAGRLADRMGIPFVALLSFLTLGLFAACLSLTTTYHQVLAGFGLYGLAMGGVSVCWTLGPVHFAGSKAAARYMGVHFALVGLRAPIGFPLGGWLAHTFHPRFTFTCAVLFFFLSVLAMLPVLRRERGPALDGPRPGGA